MSDVETTTESSKVGAWTEEAKYQFLLRIVAQLRADGRAINWSKINMPGRTTKSLQNMWTKINKMIADLEEQQADGNPSPLKTPSKKAATPRKSRTPKSKAIVDNDDDGEVEASPKKVTPKKRGTADDSPSKRGKKLKAEDEDESNSMIKTESDGLVEAEI